MADQIVIELIGDPSGLKPAEEALKELSKISDENKEAFTKANEAMKKFQEGLTEVGKKAGETAESTKKLNEGMKALGERVEGIKKLSDAVDDIGKAARRSIASISGLNAAIAAGVVGQATRQIREWSASIDENIEKKIGLVAQLDIERAKLQELIAANKQGEDVYKQKSAIVKQLALESGRLTQALQRQGVAYNQISDNAIRAGAGQRLLEERMRAAAEAAERESKASEKLGNSSEKGEGKITSLSERIKVAKNQTSDLLSHTKELTHGVGILGEAMAHAAGNEDAANEIKEKTEAALKGLAIAQTVLTVATEGATIATLEFDVATAPVTGTAVLIAAAIAALTAEFYGVYKAVEYVVNYIKQAVPGFKIFGQSIDEISKMVAKFGETARDIASILTGGLIDNAKLHESKKILEDTVKISEKQSEELKGQVEKLEAQGAAADMIAQKKKEQLEADKKSLEAQKELAKQNHDSVALKEIEKKLAENEVATIKSAKEMEESKVETLKQEGASNLEILKAKKEQVECAIEENDQKINSIMQQIILAGNDEARTKELKEQLKVMLHQSKVLNSQHKEVMEDFEEEDQKKADAAQAAYAERLAQKKALADAELSITVAGSKEELNAKINDINAAAKVEINAVKGYSAEAQKIREDLRKKANQDIDKANADYNIRQLQDMKTGLEVKLALTRGNADARKQIEAQIALKEKEIALTQANLTADQKLLIEQNYQDKLIQNQLKYDTEALNAQLKSEKEQLDGKATNSKEALDIKHLQLADERQMALDAATADIADDKKRNEEIARINKEFDAKDKQLDEDHAIWLENMEKEHIKKVRDLKMAALKDQLADDQESFGKKAQIIRQIHDLERDSINDQITDLQAKEAEEVKGYAEGSAERLAIEKKYGDQIDALKAQSRKNDKKEDDDLTKVKMENVKKYGQEALKIAKEVSDAIFANAQQKRDNDLKATEDNLEAQKNAELLNTTLTASQRNAIEKKYKAEEANEKLKAWKADQKAKEEQAIINGLLAFTTTLANDIAAFPESLVPASLALATAGVQAGIIASKTPPKFATGTPGSMVTPEGFKWVGEKGPELIYTPGGEKIMTNIDSIALLEKYRIPAMPSIDYLLDGTGVHMATGNNREVVAAISELRKDISNLKQVNVSIDKNGYKLSISKNNNRTEYLNAKAEL